jgi:ribosomal protein S18 acetylase RimI-like enzyme
VTTIRAATSADVDGVLALWAAATVEPSVTDDPAGVCTLLSHDPDALLLAVDDDTIVGSVIASWDGWRGTMYRLAVLPPYRRRGIASALVTEGERRLHARGARRLHLIVLEDERPANAFWTAAGYTPQSGRSRFVKTFPDL